MKKGIVNIIGVLAMLLALSGCGTTSNPRLAPTYGQPILSAAEAKSMIRVEVRALEPISAKQAVAALTD